MSTQTSGRAGEASLDSAPRPSGQGSPPARCTPEQERIAQAMRVAAAFGLSEQDALRMPKQVAAVLDRKAAQLGLTDTNTKPQHGEEEDDTEVLAW